ncbi:UNVERIFIED_CONTAM: hypothetical protein FKN15_039866 [Acipenser sinensis]
MRHWEPLARQQAQALALAPTQLTLPAPVVAPDVTKPDFSIAEEDHDCDSITATWEGGSFLQKQPLPPLAIPLDQRLRNCCSALTENARHLGSPLTFSKCMDAILAPLQLQVIRVMNYLDDWLICPSRRKEQWPTQRFVMKHLLRLDLTLNDARAN